MRFVPIFALSCVLMLSLSACSTFGKSDSEAKTQSDQVIEKIKDKKDKATADTVEDMYNRAAAKMDEGAYKAAAKLFDDVEREFPYSSWATRAQLMAGYAHYRDISYDDALLALDRFIQLHPGDESIDYAYYLKSLCYYEQISDVRRDQKMTELALDSLIQITERFPDTRYARDASLKIDLTLDHLAGKEMEIGRYYLIRNQYQAAINRFQLVVNDYQTTTHVPEALHRLTETYLALGIRPEAEKAAAVLGHNYPSSQWYRDSYTLLTGQVLDDENAPQEKSIYDKTIGRIF